MPAQLAGPTAWIFGNEARGLPPELVAAADQTRPGADLRRGGEPEPGRGRRRLPVRLGPRPARRPVDPGAVKALARPP